MPMNIDMDPAQAVQSINEHDHTAGTGQPIPAGGLAKDAVESEKIKDGAVTASKYADKSISLAKVDDAFRAKVEAAGSGSVVGVSNYLANGLTLVPGTGLQLTVKSGTAWISDTAVRFDTDAGLTLSPRMAAMIYARKDKSIGKVEAAYPEPDDNTICQWRFNLNGDQPIVNYAVGRSAIAMPNNLVNYGGLARTDGWCDYAVKADGSTGYYVSQNSTGFPLGAAPVQIDCLFTVNSITAASQLIWIYGQAAASAAWQLGINSSGGLFNSIYGIGIDTGFTVSIGSTYFVSSQYDGNTITVYVNGLPVFKGSYIFALAAGAMNVFRNIGGGNYSNATIHYIEMRNKLRTNEQIAQIANRFCLPCSYTKSVAVYPIIAASDATSGTHEWKFDESTGTSVADSFGVFNGIATGSTIVDSPQGLGRARSFNGISDKVDFGAKVTGTGDFTIIVIVTLNSTKIDNVILSNGGYGTSANAGFGLSCNNSNALSFQEAYSTSGQIESASNVAMLSTGKPTFIAVSSPAAIGSVTAVYVDSPNPAAMYTKTKARVTPTYNLYAAHDPASPGYFGAVKIDYLLVIPRALSQAEIVQYYNSLMGTGKRDIREILPADAVSLGFARTSSASILEMVDASNPGGITPDWIYGIRSGFAGIKNRRKFLGWKYYNGAVLREWENPFGTRRISTIFHWAQDSVGTNEIDVQPALYSGGNAYGTYFQGTQGKRIQANINPYGAAVFNNGWQGSGYIGCYAEVLDND